MTQQVINTGTADKGNGDPIRTAFTKVNANFTELYNQVAASVVVDATAPTDPSEGGLWWDPESGRMYVYYGTSWVDASPVDGAGISSTNQLVNGAYTVSLGTDGLVSVTGAIGWGLDENSPTLTDATINKVGDNLEIKTNLNLGPYTWSFSNLSKLTLPSGAVIDTYADGSENSTYFWGGNGQVIAVRGMNAENVYGGGIDIKPNGSVDIIAQDENSATWTFTKDGNLTVPDRITFSDDTWQSTAFIGHAYSLRNSPTGNLYVTLDDSGTINTPLLLPLTFTAVLDPEHYVGEGTLVLEGDAWEYTVQFQVEQDGTVQTMFDNQPWPSNPGYINGVEFEFLEADHSIPGYTFTLTLNSIQNPNPGVYTANPAVSQPPEYPATVASLGAIKLVAGEATWVFGTGGQLTVPGPIFRDGGLYMNSSGSTTAASVFVSGNSGDVILRTADNAEQISYDLTLDVNGETSFPGRLNFADGSTLGDNILTGAIDSDLGLEIKRIVTVSGVAAAGSTTGTLIVDISEDDDITVVLDGWEINAGTGIAPIWMAVTETTVDPGNTYEIVVPEFVFEPGNTYTFRNPVPESQTWFIRNQTGGLVAPGGAIITNETAPLGGGGTYSGMMGLHYTSGGLMYFDFSTPTIYVDPSRFSDSALLTAIQTAPIGTVFDFSLNSIPGGYTFTTTSLYSGGELTGTTTVPGGQGAPAIDGISFTISSSGTYRELAIELPTPDGLNEQRWVFANDGDFTAPGDIFAGSFLGQSLEITDAGIVSSTYAGDLQTLHVAGAVGKGLSLAVDGGLTSWLFKPDGSITFPDNTVQTTAYPGITNTHNNTATLVVGQNVATRGNLSVRLTNNSNTLDVEINYENPDNTVSVSAYRMYPASVNVYTGRTSKVPGNTTWDNFGNLPSGGDSLGFTFTDHSFLKVYRVTIIADIMPSVGAAGEAFCTIEELK